MKQIINKSIHKSVDAADVASFILGKNCPKKVIILFCTC
jgi:hypothetical protein